MPCRVPGRPQDGAEPARVVQTQSGVIREPELDVIVLAARGIRVDDAQAARHAEVHDQRAVLKPDQDVLGASFYMLDPLSLQVLERRYGPAQAVLVDDRLGDASPDDMRLYAAAGGFDLGQFRHAQGPTR